MGALNELLHRRPEIVGKFSPLNNNSNVIPISRHAIRSTHDVVFSNWSVEHSVIAKLIQHSFADVENPLLFLRCYVLTKKKGVGIATEFFLHRM